MKEKELKFLISQGEGYNIEFKEKFSASIAKDICAFANSSGGRILLGVTDCGKIKGINITNRLKSQIIDLTRNFDPKLNISLNRVGNVLIINVPEGKNKPYSVKGKFFVRYGANSQQLTRDEIKDFFISEGCLNFDEKPNPDFNMKEDFNAEAFKIFLRRSGITGRIRRINLLKNLGLFSNGNLKNAGVLLFCKKATKFFPNATIMCVVFQGKTKYKILDSKEFDSDLYSNYENAMQYIISKLNTEYIIRGGPREEILEIPEDALREALLNAIAHRDYFMSGHIQVNIFLDRIEIVNPGGLVKGLSLEDLGKISRPRNHLLFSLMQRMDLVEKAGTGIMRIRESMKKYRLKPPIIEPHETWFSISFIRPDLQTESYEQRMANVPENVPENVPKRLAQIITIMRANRNITVPRLARMFMVSEKTIKRDIKKLKEQGRIKRVGSAKGGYWEVLESR
ncbi:MAG: putative DNA binding domain-containing protein [Candidatus Diapherotrites archaeon]|nr:putative DNA binding domain-containing protein [Candidatus Diapherotrites archaeon]